MKLTLIRLSPQEVEVILRQGNFNHLQPVSCQECGNTGPFERMVFRIAGVAKKQVADERVHALIRAHLQQQEKLVFVHFKSIGSLYADAARCPSCGSSAIVYDIDFSPALMNNLAKLLGQPARWSEPLGRGRLSP